MGILSSLELIDLLANDCVNMAMKLLSENPQLTGLASLNRPVFLTLFALSMLFITSRVDVVVLVVDEVVVLVVVVVVVRFG